MVVGILRIDAALNGMPTDFNVFLPEWQPFSGGHVHLQMYQVEAGHKFRYGVLNLQAGIHFEEIEVALLVHQEFDSTGVVIIRGLGDTHRYFTHALPHVFVRRLADGDSSNHLLVAALHRALALAQIDRVAVLVGRSTCISMWRGLVDELLEIQLTVAERALGLAAARPRRRSCSSPGAAHHSHAFAAAAGRCFEHDRIADLLRQTFGGLDIIDRAQSREQTARRRASCAGGRASWSPSCPLTQVSAQ